MVVIKNLKTLFSNWINLRSDAEETYHTRMDENVTYTSGVFNVTEAVTQSINLSVNTGAPHSGYALCILTCTVSPKVAGQQVTFKSSYATKTGTTNNNGVCISDAIRVDDNNSIHVTVDELLHDNKYYSGGETQYTLNR